MAITPKEEQFCQEYLVDLNQTAAAQRAGYSPKNRRAAQTTASTLMDKPEVRARVQELMDARSAAVGINAKTVLEELLKIATVDLAQAYHPDGKLKSIHEIPEATRRAISAVKVYDDFEFNKDLKAMEKVGETEELKFYDKVKALELLARHLKLLTDKIEITDANGIAKRLLAARERRGKK